MAGHFTQKYARRMNKQIDTIRESTIQKLQRWFWPGNVRELENLIERSVILTCNSVLSVSLPEKMNSAIDAAAVAGEFVEQRRSSIRFGKRREGSLVQMALRFDWG
jgi:DNA-binding NtrC family response regulator